jgi:DNA-binding NtrC family response regulator
MAKRFTIFIVEDNAFYTFFLNEVLKEHGNFNITTFENAENCLEVLDTQPDLIIQDYFLNNGMNGWDAFRTIHRKYPKLPVIVLTGQSDVQVAADFVEAGVYDYIEKKDKEAIRKLKDAILRINYKQGA